MLSEYIHIMFSFPTVIFTVPLAIAAFYWLSVVMGIADAEILDGTLEAGLDGALEGAADAALDAATDGVEPDVGDAFSLSAILLLGEVPVTLSFTFLFFWNWTICLFGTAALTSLLGDGLSIWIWGSALVALSLIASLFLTNLSARPFAPLFKIDLAASKHSFVGQVVEITTGRVDRDFGQALLEDGGAGNVLQVRSDPSNGLKKGDKAVLLSHDPENDSFEVESIEDMVASDLDDDQPTNESAE